ncbi:hypothetical protein [Actimicrobium sp. CCI2.3]|uniref:hypothetical protein n=1 Tax=Actimicrobium sp. CCI2.3 TaxID=3048616 RepID=UPI002AB4CE50|nr:hypothetical protein [Actimicrobium sp. CCI2.3]MDY7573815.1 hypothetical protein [Actimicrobium sp. CCI2.3]MEB0022426.1 hypothetical protein [Actimicrobium sp. CCI2.3]
MSALDRKLWRDLWQMKSQALAIALVVMCGVGTFIMFLSTLDALRSTQQRYYRDYRFAEVFASLKRAPESLRLRLHEIPGVDQVETRVMAMVRLDLPGFAEPVTAQVVSVSERGSTGLNALHLRSGRLPQQAVCTGSPAATGRALRRDPQWPAPDTDPCRHRVVSGIHTAVAARFGFPG